MPATYICSISGKPAVAPVISPVSGRVFEAELIINYVDEHGTDPINNEKLTVEQLVEIKTDVPKALPSIITETLSEPELTVLDDEDTLNRLRKQLQSDPEESYALFQHNAVCNVMERLWNELNAMHKKLLLRKKISNSDVELKPSDKSNPSENDVELESLDKSNPSENDVELESFDESDDELKPEDKNEQRISPKVVKNIAEKAYFLANKRSEDSLSDMLAKPSQLKRFGQVARHSGIHKPCFPGITALDVQMDMVLTGGVDKAVILFDCRSETIDRIYRGHQEKISAVILPPSKQSCICLSAADDGQVRVWSKNEETCRCIFGIHDGAVTDISLHPIGDYVLSVSNDSSWALTDIYSGTKLCQVHLEGEDKTSLRCGQFHPDGLLFGMGRSDSFAELWDITTQTCVIKLANHSGMVNQITFSENGYHVATGAEDGEVRLWDLRKMKILKSVGADEEQVWLTSVRFDESGSYLAVAGPYKSCINLIDVGSWTVLNTIQEHEDIVTAVRFGRDAYSVFSVSMDNTLLMYSVPKSSWHYDLD